MLMNRARAAQLGHETVAICRAGYYLSPAGKRVDIDQALRGAVGATVCYPPEFPLPDSQTGPHDTVVEVLNESTLMAGCRLQREGFRVCALNFASAKNPGGGFLNGARAQEESLCRSSGLWFCLHGKDMYQHNRAHRSCLYTHHAIYSPDVPVIRTDNGDLLDEPWPCSFITCPAVNAGVVLRDDPSARPVIRKVMAERTARVLAIAARHGQEALVLGAWGCGVFKNDPAEIAELFQQALTQDFRGAFRKVVFAILDWSDEHHFIGPFQRAFPATTPL